MLLTLAEVGGCARAEVDSRAQVVARGGEDDRRQERGLHARMGCLVVG